MRIRILGVIIFIPVFLLVTGLFYLQIIKGANYQRLATRNRIRLVPIESPRGRIFDRNGVLLVNNRISFDVSIITQELKNKDVVFDKLARRLNQTKESLEEALKNNFITPFQPVKIAFDIGKIKAITIEEERIDLPGVLIETAPHRHYIYKNTGSHIFGYLGLINSRELEKLKSYGYTMDDYVGRAGVEKYYDNYLKGTHGGMQIEVDNMGHQVGILGIREPIKGKDLYLSIDIRLQEFIEEIFKDARGVACVMDPRSGEILSLVSSPSFDPNIFMARKNSGEITDLFQSEDYPLLNRSTQCSYPPGSVFKIVTISAGLEKKISPERTLYCSGLYFLGGSIFRCWKEKGHGALAARDALKHSCNVYFYQLGRMAGAEEIANFATKYGFGQPTGVDLPGEFSGLVPNRMWKFLNKREPWYEGETLNYAIGQGFLLVTPMQIVRMVSSVANGGDLVRPFLVKRIEDVDISQTRKTPVNISKETLDIVKEGLIKVVNDPDGTGRRAYIKGVRVAGKTGTAQTSQPRTHAWFTGFAPSDDPKVALVVFLEYGGKGGLGASKTAHDIFAKLQSLGYL
ncbi:MAG: penicillin-binding protein 2 [Candidatus Omnitrophota bacterium]